MMRDFDRAAAFIDLDAALYNMNLMYEGLDEQASDGASKAKMIAVIKADGYGHGAVPLACKLEGLDYLYGFAVATMDEAIELRKAGIKKPVNLLGPVFAGRMDDAASYDIGLAVFDYDNALAFSDACVAAGVTGRIHIAVDTGMSRIGYYVNRESAREVFRISKLPNINIEGCFTHFYMSDAADKADADTQLSRFKEFRKLVEGEGVNIPLWHCSNSAALIDMPYANMDLVRAGISLYGLRPSDEVKDIPLKPVMKLVSRITMVKTIHKGDAVSYGATFRADKDMRIATICFGYADGYPRSLSNKGEVLIRGRRVRIVGRVCMDQFMADVSDIPDAAAGDVVTLIGQDGSERITAEELGDLSGRFNYELACLISKRVPRIYLGK